MLALVNKFKWVIAIVVGLILFALWNRWEVGQEAKQKAAAANVKIAQDSMKKLAISLDSARYELAHTSAQIDTVWIYRAAHIALAVQHGHAADSIIALVPPDTLHMCKAVVNALAERTTECAELKKTVTADSVALRSADSTIKDVNKRLDHALTQTIPQVDLHLDSLSKITTCKIAFGIHCPSRKTSVIIGIVLGGIGMRIVH